MSNFWEQFGLKWPQLWHTWCWLALATPNLNDPCSLYPHVIYWHDRYGSKGWLAHIWLSGYCFDSHEEENGEHNATGMERKQQIGRHLGSTHSFVFKTVPLGTFRPRKYNDNHWCTPEDFHGIVWWANITATEQESFVFKSQLIVVVAVYLRPSVSSPCKDKIIKM